MKRIVILSILSLALVAFGLQSNAFARPHGGGHGGGHWGGGHGGGGWHGHIDSGWRGRGDIHHFYDHDFHYWRDGYWHHGYHEDRLGWWWIVGDFWYWYPAIVSPYPDPYIPPVVDRAPPAPAVQAQAPASMWYYCDRPSGYYPYVSECPSGWRAVPASPPSMPGGSVPPPRSY